MRLIYSPELYIRVYTLVELYTLVRVSRSFRVQVDVKQSVLSFALTHIALRFRNWFAPTEINSSSSCKLLETRILSSGQTLYQSFTCVSKFRVSCIRVYAAIIVVYVFSCTNNFFYFFVYVFSCINIYFYFSWYISCINVKAYFVLSAIYYIQSLKSQFRQNFLKIKQIICFMDQPKLKKRV